jgi:hypothetical protein
MLSSCEDTIPSLISFETLKGYKGDGLVDENADNSLVLNGSDGLPGGGIVGRGCCVDSVAFRDSGQHCILIASL